MARKLLVLGTTEYAAVFVDMFQSLQDLEFVGYVENLDRGRCGRSTDGLPIFWTDEIDQYRDTHQLICSLATTLRREWIETMVGRGFRFATLVHPSSHVSKQTSLGSGVSVDAGTVVAGYSTVGDHVRIGRLVAFGHHTEIGPYATIHPGAIVSGFCKIGAGVTICTGAVVIDRITIGDGAVISAGAVVTRAVPANALFAGNPGRVVRLDYGPK
jgi:acetyltransferase EpsM